MQRIILQPAFVLHTRPFRDTSLLVELLTLHHGRYTAVARGVRTQKSRARGLVRPFMPLLVSWSGRTDLVTLLNVEAGGALHDLMGTRLLSGFYLNELLIKLLPLHDPHPEIFLLYQKTLAALYTNAPQELALRLFEKQLLAELGYAPLLDREAFSDVSVQPDRWYRFDPERGLTRYYEASQLMNQKENVAFPGKSLLALHKGELTSKEDFQVAKKIMRITMNHLLGSRSLRTRELF